MEIVPVSSTLGAEVERDVHAHLALERAIAPLRFRFPLALLFKSAALLRHVATWEAAVAYEAVDVLRRFRLAREDDGIHRLSVTPEETRGGLLWSIGARCTSSPSRLVAEIA